MAPALLLITAVLSCLITGFILSRVTGPAEMGEEAVEQYTLAERLLKAKQGFQELSHQLEPQRADLKPVQHT